MFNATRSRALQAAFSFVLLACTASRDDTRSIGTKVDPVDRAETDESIPLRRVDYQYPQNRLYAYNVFSGGIRFREEIPYSSSPAGSVSMSSSVVANEGKILSCMQPLSRSLGQLRPANFPFTLPKAGSGTETRCVSIPHLDEPILVDGANANLLGSKFYIRRPNIGTEVAIVFADSRLPKRAIILNQSTDGGSYSLARLVEEVDYNPKDVCSPVLDYRELLAAQELQNSATIQRSNEYPVPILGVYLHRYIGEPGFENLVLLGHGPQPIPTTYVEGVCAQP